MANESKKTSKMLGVEKKFKRELEKVIPELVNEFGLTGAAKHLGVGKATLSYWMLKLGIQFRKVALALLMCNPDVTRIVFLFKNLFFFNTLKVSTAFS